MEVKFSSGARKLLEEKGAENICIHLVDIATADSIGAARDIEVNCEVPEQKEQFWWDRVGGIDVYIDKKLKIIGPVVVKKQGFWIFSSLYADGLRILI